MKKASDLPEMQEPQGVAHLLHRDYSDRYKKLKDGRAPLAKIGFGRNGNFRGITLLDSKQRVR